MHPVIERFCVGSDQEVDTLLLPADIVASIAHAKTLQKATILTEEECSALILSLQKLFMRAKKGEAIITKTHEDSHSAIEDILSTEHGDVGRKIHTGRSRNDQIQGALRLYLREKILLLVNDVSTLVKVILERAEQYHRVPMMGRTHLQPAMISGVGFWFACIAEELTEEARELLGMLQGTLNRSPLGAAAGYGSPIHLDRAYTARLLGFKGIQNNMLAVQNARGRIELRITHQLHQIGLIISRFSEDLILYTLKELGYFSLPATMSTGSSIMPQKKNPDVLELLRTVPSESAATYEKLSHILKGIGMGYHRDLQKTKEACVQLCAYYTQALEVCTLVFRELEVHETRIRDSITEECLITDSVFDLVKEKNISFRDAYRHVALDLANKTSHTALSTRASDTRTRAALLRRTSLGSPGKLNLTMCKTALAQVERSHIHFLKAHQQVLTTLIMRSDVRLT